MTPVLSTHQEVRDLIAKDPARAAIAARELVAAKPSDEEAAELLRAAVLEETKASPEPPVEEKPKPNPVLETARKELNDGHEEQAELLVREYLKQFPNDFRATLLMGEIAARCDFFDDADRIFLHAIALAPAEPLPRISLARFRQQIGRLDDAIELLDQVITLRPTHHVALSLKPTMLMQSRKLAEAEAGYLDLIRAWPRDGLAWMNLASLLNSLGRYGESVAAYRTAVALKPTFGGGWWGIANLRIASFFPQDIEAMIDALEAPEIDPKDEVGIHYALFQAHNKYREFDDAFAHLRRANELQKSKVTRQRNAANRDPELLRGVFTPDLLRTFTGSGSRRRDPIFIVGMHRAGSTLVEQILASHSNVEGTEELFDLNRIASRLAARFEGESWLEVIDRVPAEQLRETGELYIAHTQLRRRTDKPRFTDKMPLNWEYAGLIHLILPNAKILDVRRHPLDCCFSIYGQHFQPGVDYAFDLADIGRYYRAYVACMAHIDRVLPNRVHRIFHEDLVDNFETEVRNLLTYLELPFEASCLDFHSTDRAVHTPSSQQVRQPINRRGQGRWRNYEEHLQPLKSALGSVLDVYPKIPTDVH
jgi:tetratricopeptide (TPR) repeat protein